VAIGDGDVGIVNEASLILDKCLLRRNGDRSGPGVYPQGGIFNAGTLLMMDSAIVSNESISGGGITNSGRAILRTRIENNTAKGSPAPDAGKQFAGGYGGGIANTPGAVLVLLDSTVVNNVARIDGGASTMWGAT
jgi:hypothetical protein